MVATANKRDSCLSASLNFYDYKRKSGAGDEQRRVYMNGRNGLVRGTDQQVMTAASEHSRHCGQPLGLARPIRIRQCRIHRVAKSGFGAPNIGRPRTSV